MKIGSASSFIRKYKFNPQWDTTTHTLERHIYKQNTKILTITSADEDVEHRALTDTLLIGMENVTATVENSLAVSFFKFYY